MICHHSCIHHSHFLLTPAKKFNRVPFILVATLSDYSALQEDVTALFTWSRDSILDFNLKTLVHLSFKCETLAHCIPGSYTIANYLTHTHILCIPQYDSHKDLGLILSEDVYWDKHYKPITACAYKMLGLILLHYSLLLFNFHNG